MSAPGTSWTSRRTDNLLDLWYWHNGLGRQFTIAEFARANGATERAIRGMLVRARKRGDERAVYARQTRIRRAAA